MDANNSHGYITSPLTLYTSLQDQDASDKKIYPNFHIRCDSVQSSNQENRCNNWRISNDFWVVFK